MARTPKKKPRRSPGKNVPSVRPTLAVGRAQELRHLRNLLRSDKTRAVGLFGAAGQGKSTLLRMFANENEKSFPGGIYYVSQPEASPISFGMDERFLLLLKNIKKINGPSLVIWDDFDNSPAARASHVVESLRDVNAQAKIIFTSRRALSDDDVDAEIHLDGLKFDEFSSLCRLTLDTPTNELIRSLYDEFRGNPLAAQIMARASMGEARIALEILRNLRPFDRTGLVGPDGKPIDARNRNYRTIISGVRAVNQELLKLLAEQPDRLYQLTSRQFEEVVAELMERQGYEITLTPRTRDGGKDIYAATQTSLGRFLYIVECKRYAPDRPIGVGIVRHLFGQVQKERVTAGILATTSFFTKAAVEFRRDLEYQLSFQDYVGLRRWWDEVVGLLKPDAD